MTAIPSLTSTLLTSTTAGTAAAAQTDDTAKALAQQNQQAGYGPAYVLDISNEGQASLKNAAAPTASAADTTADTKDNTTTSDTSTDKKADASKPAPPPKAPPTGGGGGVSYSDVSSAEETAKRKVRPEVGSVGADEVVDSKGDIDQRKLNELLQAQKAQAHKFDAKS